MFLTPLQTVIMIFAVAFGAMLTRFLPFLIFPVGKKRPQVIDYLGKVLPAAMMGLLVIYCLKDVSLKSALHGIPEVLSIISIVLIHKWKHNVLLSIGIGTALYMILIRM